MTRGSVPKPQPNRLLPLRLLADTTSMAATQTKVLPLHNRYHRPARDTSKPVAAVSSSKLMMQTGIIQGLRHKGKQNADPTDSSEQGDRMPKR